MKKRIVCFIGVGLLASNLFGVNVTSIEQLDDLAEFSFSVMGDNNGYEEWQYNRPDGGTPDSKAKGMARLQPWVENNDEFCLGVGDHAIGTRKYWIKMTEKDSFWHNHYYPVLGDNGNETDYFYGSTADQATWGRGWVQFKALNNFFNRNTSIDRITFRPKGSTPVQSSKSKAESNVMVNYPDQLCEYYARRTQGAFTFHIIGLNIPDPGVLTPRSKNFMVNKLNELAVSKTDYDVIIVNAQKARWVKRAEDYGWMSRSERDLLMLTADLILCGDDHIYRRQNEFDSNYNGTEALWMNAGQPCSTTGSGRGYLNFHMFDHPPRFTAQYILTDPSTRALHVNAYQIGSTQKSLPAECTKPYLKYINGQRVSVNWSNFPVDGAPPPVDTTPPTVSFNTPSGNTTVDAGSNLYVKVDASDANGLSRVYLHKDGVQLARSEGGAPYEWNAAGQSDSELQNLQAGSFVLKARAVDGAGNEKETSITITVGAPPVQTLPVVSFNTPSGNTTLTVGEDLAVTVDATDPDGISQVRLYKDGVLIRGEGGAPYEWNNPTQTNDVALQNLQAGTFILTAEATDSLGSIGQASSGITVTVTGVETANLVQNGSFENGAAFWTVGNAAVVTTDPQEGSQSLKISVPSSGNTTQTIPIETGVTYDLSVWINASGMTSGNAIFDTLDQYDDVGEGQFVMYSANSGWTQYSGRFTATNTSMQLRLFTSSTFAGTIYYDNIVVEPSLPDPVGPAGYTYCSDEGGSFVLPGVCDVAYGANGMFTYLYSQTGTIAFNNATFGDPASGVPKAGFYKVSLLTGYDAWAAMNSVGPMSSDHDSDGRLNLLEYAIGGNPTGGVDSNLDPILTKVTDAFQYSFKQRNDDSNLTYSVQVRSDLTSGDWADSGATSAINGTSGAFHNVTYTIQADQPKTYIRLEVSTQ